MSGFGNGHKVNAITNTWLAIVLICAIASITVLVALGKVPPAADQVLVGVVLGHVGTLSSGSAAAAQARVQAPRAAKRRTDA